MEFPMHPKMVQWVRPRLNRRTPYELHWRKEVPEWPGSIDKARGHLYSQLAEEHCCLQCGAVPCPYDHEEHKRLKLADLDFVKELAKDRRELKEKLGKYENLLKTMEEKQSEWLAAKQVLLERLQHYEQLQKEWNRQKEMMEGEIQRLKLMNTDNLRKLQNYKKDQEKLRILTNRVEKLERENAALREENQRAQQTISRQADDLRQLETTNQELVKQNQESGVHIMRLRVQLDETSDELIKSREALAENQQMVRDLERERDALIKELVDRTREFQERDEANSKRNKHLEHQLEQLRGCLLQTDGENAELKAEILRLLAEIERLKARMSGDTRFRKFVDIKRECNDLKEQNQTLKVKVYEQEQICPPVPFMAASGRVRSAEVRRRNSRSPPAGTRRPQTAVNGPQTGAMLNRPKSSRTLTALSNQDNGDVTDNGNDT